MLSRKLRET